MRSLALLGFVLSVLLIAPGLPAQAEAPASLTGVVPKVALNQLRSLAVAFARKKHVDTANEIVDLCRTAGLDGALVERLEADVEKAAKRAKRRGKNVRSEASKAKAIAKRLAKLIGGVDGAAKRTLAALVLRLDAEVENARRVLGHTKRGGEWRSPREWTMVDRRRDIQAKLAAARKLPVPLTTAESAHPVFQALERPAIAVTYRGFTFHSDLGVDRTVSVVRAALRATALSSWLRGGPFALPERITGSSSLIIERRVDYDRVIDMFVKRGVLTAAEGKNKKTFAWFFPTRGLGGNAQPVRWIRRYVSFGHTFSSVMFYLSSTWQYQDGKEAQACLQAGHLNWVCLAYLGSAIPPIYDTKTDTGTKKRDYALEGDGTETWKSVKELLGAGLMGNRSWLRYLARQRLDPAWANAMVGRLAELKADDVLKCTFVAEYLHETGELPALIRKSMRDSGAAPRKTMVKALGESLPSFEQRWRAWLCDERGTGLVQRYTRKPVKKVGFPPDALRALAYVNRIRRIASERTTGGWKVALDAELSAGAVQHAKYLALNPEQAAAWPDAHEQYTERKGFSPAGSWAAAHSVIAPGVRSAEEAVDGWMATFYHRLPLLNPCLIRIGWGFRERVAVLDSTSMIDPQRVATWVKWPVDGARKVPVAFAPELPNPVPGQDQSAFGYPITIQHFSTMETVQVPRMRLYVGTMPSGEPVPCYLSTPGRPTNRELVPDGASCLIPKAHLRPKTTYTVVAETEGGETFTWRFTTG